MVPKADMNMHLGPCKKRNKNVSMKQKQAKLQKKKAKLLRQAAADAGVDPNQDVDAQVRAMERKLAALKAAQQTAESVLKNDPNNMKKDSRTGTKIDLMAEIERAANSIDQPEGAEADGRIPCSQCGRKFTAARICLHEDICLHAAEKEAKNKKKFKVKTGEDLRLKGTEFAQYKNRRAPDPENKGKAWREEAFKLHQVVKEGRNVVRFQRAGVPLSELPSAGQEMELRVGNAIMANDGRRGVVKFVGDVMELPGDDRGAVRTFIGVEFNRPTGQNDGMIDGKRYFDGRPGHCSFMRPAKLLIVKSSSGDDLSTNVRRKKRGYQKDRAPASETMTKAQKMNKNKDKAQVKKDTVVRRAAQMAAQRAARGQSIGNRLKKEREESGRIRASQLRLENRAEGGDQEAMNELMRLKEAGEWVAITGGYRDKELRNTKRGKKAPVQANSIPKFSAAAAATTTTTTTTTASNNKQSKPPTPPESAASPTMRAPKKKVATNHLQSRTPDQPKPQQTRPARQERTQKQIAAAAAAERRTLQGSKKPSRTTQPDRLRKEVNASRTDRPRSREKTQQLTRPQVPPAANRGNGGAGVSREERARQAGARRKANERVRQRKAQENSKENAGLQVMSKGQVKWSAAPDKGGVAARGKPYGESGLSDASRKYRAKKAAGSGGVGNDMDAASAVYKARIRAKQRKKKKPLSTSYAAPGSMAAEAQKAKQRAKGKAAFGSGSGSVADDMNEVVFGKGKVKRKIYTADGKTKEIGKARPKGGANKKTGGNTSGRSPRTSPAARQNATNNADMGRGGKKVGGSVVKHRAMDPREARLAALAKRGLA